MDLRLASLCCTMLAYQMDMGLDAPASINLVPLEDVIDFESFVFLFVYFCIVFLLLLPSRYHVLFLTWYSLFGVLRDAYIYVLFQVIADWCTQPCQSRPFAFGYCGAHL